MKRIFISIDIPDELKNTLEAFFEFLSRNVFLKPIGRNEWHITLLFCGNINETELAILRDILLFAVSSYKSFFLIPAGVSFSPEKNPRMIWFKFEPSSGFADLKKIIDDKIAEKQREGFFRDFKREIRWPFIPHLTLARFKPEYFYRLKNLFTEKIDLLEDVESFPVGSVNITESHLSRDGAEYELLDKFSFAGST